MLKLLLALMVGASVWGSVSAAPLPKERPENLNRSSVIPEGEFIDGKIKLSVPLLDALYYQRENREQTIPIMDYLINDYPNIDFNTLKFTRIMVVATAHSDYANLSFMSSNGVEILNNDIPRVSNPGVVFGEYSQAILEDYQIFEPLSYLSVSGAMWINNIIVEMETGVPNFNINDLPLEGRPTGDLSGVLRPEFNEEKYTQLYNVINGIEETPDLETSLFSDTLFDQPVEETYNPEFSLDIRLGNIRKNSGKLNIKLLRGRADIKGFDVVFPDGSTNYIDMAYVFPRGKNNVDIIFKRSYKNAWVKVLFTNATPDAQAELKFKR